MTPRQSSWEGLDTYILYPDAGKLEFLAGCAPGEGGSGLFYDPQTEPQLSQAAPFDAQPSQFDPRLDWSHDEDGAQSPRLDRNSTLDQIRQELGRLAAMPAWTLANGKPRKLGNKKWMTHCQDLWTGLFNMIDAQWATTSYLESLLYIISYSLEISVCPMRSAPTILSPEPRAGSSFASRPSGILRNHLESSLPYNDDLPLGVERVRFRHSFGTSQPQQWKRDLHRKRFYIGLVNWEQSHWAGIIWDRTQGQLYIYDSYRPNRELRIHQVVLAWREILAGADMPYDFEFIAPPMTQQPSVWECGYLAVFNILLHIRGLVGASISQLTELRSPTLIAIDGKARVPQKPFYLRHRDWAQGHPRSHRQGAGRDSASPMDFVRAVLQCMTLNDLGIRPSHLIGELRGELEASWMRSVEWDLQRPLRPLPKHQFYTIDGGLQMAVRSDSTVVPTTTATTLQAFRIIPLPSHSLQKPFAWKPNDARVDPDTYQPGSTSSGLAQPVEARRDRTFAGHARQPLDNDTGSFIATLSSPQHGSDESPQEIPSCSPGSQEDELCVAANPSLSLDLVKVPSSSATASSSTSSKLVTPARDPEPQLELEPESEPEADLDFPVESEAEVTKIAHNGSHSLFLPNTTNVTSSFPLVRRPFLHPAPLIHGAESVTATDDNVARWAREAEASMSSQDNRGATWISSEVARRIDLPVIADRSIWKIPSTGRYVSYVPDGLIGHPQWANVIEAAHQPLVRSELAMRNPVVPPRGTGRYSTRRQVAWKQQQRQPTTRAGKRKRSNQGRRHEEEDELSAF